MGEAKSQPQDSPVELWKDLSHELWQVQLGMGGIAEARLMTLDELDAAFKREEINARTLVRRPGTQSWKTLGAIAGLEPDADVRTTKKSEPAKPPPLPRKRPAVVVVGPLSREELSVAKPKIVSAKLIGVAVLALFGGALLVARHLPVAAATPPPPPKVVEPAAVTPPPPPAIAFGAAAPTPTPVAVVAPAAAVPAPPPTTVAPAAAAAAPTTTPPKPHTPAASPHAVAAKHAAPSSAKKAAPPRPAHATAHASSAHYPWKTKSALTTTTSSGGNKKGFSASAKAKTAAPAAK